MRKYLIILGVLVALLIVFVVLNMQLGKDDTRPLLENAYNNNGRIAALSQEATSRSSVYGLKVAAANIQAVTASDAQSLASYYKKRFSKTIKSYKPSGDQTLASLKKTEDGVAFDNQFKQLITQELESNIATMRSVTNNTKRADLKDLMNQAINNQSQAVEQIKNLP